MKTTSFGISAFLITVVTLIIIAEINLGATRQSLLEDNLNDGMSAALQMALDERGYAIGDENELVTDIVEYLSLYILEDCSLDVEVIGADLSTGIVSLKVTEHYLTAFGRVKDITCTRTVLLEDRPVDLPDSYTVQYVIQDVTGRQVLYKKYTMREGSTILYPSVENYNLPISGWAATPGGTILSAAEITSLPLDKDYTFYAILN